MVHQHRGYLQQQRKGDLQEVVENPAMLYYLSHRRRSSTVLLRLIFLFSFISCFLLFFPRPFSYSLMTEEEAELRARSQEERWAIPCSSFPNNTICCDRAAFRTDVCFLRGDVRTQSSSNSIFLLTNSTNPIEERIRPYTRKWEAAIMNTIDELRLRVIPPNPDESPAPRCDVHHDVPAVVFSTGGYTGNVYHEFNDGLIPLYITSQHFNRKVVFVMLEYHHWWMTKYRHVISRLSDYPPIDFSGDRRIHCFPEAVVGLKIHDELTIDPSRMDNNNNKKSILDFRELLDEAYKPRVMAIDGEESHSSRLSSKTQKPKLVIVSRNGSRAIENERELANSAEELGFRVQVLRPKRSTELARIYRALNSCDAMVGVHGAAMTHFLFMRPGSVFIQIVPLGTDWAAETYYGEPAKKLGLHYLAYKILPGESSLYQKYSKNDPVLQDPDGVNAKGWQVTKKVYLDGQNVRLDLDRFRRHLAGAYQYLALRRMRQKKHKHW
ncbi:xylan glycosyltransferase MUCI21-like isoform X1 [Typha angustifolia]|uniref:xylan glycosyltransferase MUCI21-like isoform X1 n=2 Tax=Typha angustifolia TaxID=59011 RepID=UPI003C2E47E3